MQTVRYQEVRIYSPTQPKCVHTAPVEHLEGVKTKHAGLKLHVSRHSPSLQ